MKKCNIPYGVKIFQTKRNKITENPILHEIVNTHLIRKHKIYVYHIFHHRLKTGDTFLSSVQKHDVYNI